MIYFPVYAHMKKDVFHEGKQGKVLSLTELLCAAGIGGVPAGE
jgi:solute carrier family 25 aspartate/glutamate transporter 12/13